MGVDVGGTFTDLVALTADGGVTVRKVPSTPDDPTKGMVAALDAFRVPIALLVHGTTVATNALLERTGARVVLVTTAGFEDLLWLRRQDRAALYDLGRHHPEPLVTRDRVVGVRERIGPDGVVVPLDEMEMTRAVARVAALAPEAIAVSLLFAFRHPAHERALALALERALPDVPVVTSHQVLPVFREYERFATTAAEAFLRPRVGAYVERAGAAVARLGTGALRVMTSAGGTLAPAAAARRAAALALSGPAGGVVGARLAGLAAGERDLLTLDMGGTSADAGLVLDGAVLSQSGTVVGGVPLALPAVLIETVSAGGGSLAWVDDGGALRVGPRSAGAVPGPACYGRGGDRPTVTDACVVLGWLDPDHPLAGVRVDAGAATRAVGTLASAVGRDAVGTAAGVVAVATAVMARALKRVSVARGVDPRGLTLVPFGGAGALFGCALADALGMSKVLVPPHPGVLSACGLAAAAERVDRVASLHRPLAALDPAALASAFEPVVADAQAELPGAGVARSADCRFAGQGYEVRVSAPHDDPAALREAFLAAHRARYGYADDAGDVEVVNLRAVAERGGIDRFPVRDAASWSGAPGRRRIAVGGRAVDASVWPLDALPPGVGIAGPAVLAGDDATALIEPGWHGTVHASGAVVIERDGGGA
ncbi:MAG TPA: hydantoinase/oxoprolinase family protein [Gemmatimonadales bacterium]|nr:hydantoinase/oxoprolinase family protein [Gemmatimonadales bacterium]